MTTETRIPVPTEPAILSANVYYWRPASHASARRSNEERHHREVREFLEAAQPALVSAGVEVRFFYSESCHHVYKSCRITRQGRRSNITAVRAALAAWSAHPSIVPAGAVVLGEEEADNAS